MNKIEQIRLLLSKANMTWKVRDKITDLLYDIEAELNPNLPKSPTPKGKDG